MAYRRCDSGEHHYDDAQYSGCPYCRRTRVPLPRESAGFSDIPPPQEPPPMPGKTTPAYPPSDGPSNSNAKNTRIVDIFDGDKPSSGVIPAVGWLVVVNGKGRGRDLHILPGRNTIGREKGDIVLDFGDDSISRENNAVLSYDSGQFTLIQSGGRNLIKVNGEPVHTPRELAAYDRILIGQTEMIFMPLCGPQFSWKAPEDS